MCHLFQNSVMVLAFDKWIKHLIPWLSQSIIPGLIVGAVCFFVFSKLMPPKDGELKLKAEYNEPEILLSDN